MSFKPKRMIVTGGAGFIGSAFVRMVIEKGCYVVVLDALTYAGVRDNVEDVLNPTTGTFVQGSIGNFELVSWLLKEHNIDTVVNFAAESHVDNSISGPRPFVETNVVGVFNLLEAIRSQVAASSGAFRLVHVSTDEVFGALGNSGYFVETTPYAPSSPYSATKAASDHLVMAWNHTFGVPAIVTNCSNNYGPRQFPEKLIPRMILNALKGEKLPVYGKGQNVRDWIHVEDHAAGIWLALTEGRIGESYCFGGRSERKNLDVVHSICQVMDELVPLSGGDSYVSLVEFVTDRLGHDWRYAIDDTKAERDLGFTRKYTFEEGLKSTVTWYLENRRWIEDVSRRKS